VSTPTLSIPPLFLRLHSKVIPKVFQHYIWIDYIKSNPHPSPELIQNLLVEAHQYETSGDIVSSCQILISCAYLQKKTHQYEAAVESVQHAWNLAKKDGLHPIERWAAWGEAAIYFHQGDTEAALEQLIHLQEIFGKEGNWILANTIRLLRQTLQWHDPSDPYLEEVPQLLLHWGDPSLAAFQGAQGDIPKKGPAGRPNPSEPSGLRILVMRLKTIWQAVRYSASGRLSLQKLDTLVSSPEPDRFAETPDFSTSDPARLEKPSQDQEFETARDQTPSRVEAQLQRPSPFTNPTGIKAVKDSGPTLFIYCLGNFRIFQDNQLINDWTSRRALSVLKYLIAQHPSPVSKDILMDTFWPEMETESARRNLHQAVYSLRKTLSQSGLDIQYILFKDDAYLINRYELRLWIDFHQFEKHARIGQQMDRQDQIQEAVEQLGIAEGLYGGEFLEEDLYDDWTILQRAHLKNLYLDIATQLSQHFIDQGETIAANALCRKILAQDHLYEKAHRLLMECYDLQGQHHMAIRQFQICQKLLKEELGLSPRAETLRLYEKITGIAD
jgi:DNA-binding SARP family transcriptional activator